MSSLRTGPRPIENLRALTGARFVAAFGVLLCHFGRGVNWPAWVTGHGAEAVAFFFVLSGFVLMYNYVDRLPDGNRSEYLGFLQARFARVYPVYLLVLLLATAETFWIWHRDPSQRLDLAAGPMAAGWIANLLMVQSYSISGPTGGYWSGPAWSLSCEATFYAAFPLLLWQMRRLRSRGAMIGTGVAIWLGTVALVVAAWVVARVVFHKTDLAMMYLTYRAPYLRISEFALGCLAGLWYVRGGREVLASRAVREAAVWGTLAVASTIAVLSEAEIIPRHYGLSLAFTPMFVVFTVALASGQTSIGRMLSTEPMVRLGEASYSLYLLHWLLLLLPERHVLVPDAGFAVMAILGSVLASLGLYQAVEDPCRKLLRLRPMAGPGRTPALAKVLTN